MKKIRIGLGRFYNGNLVELEAEQKIALKLTTAEYQVEVLLSDTTKHLLQTITFDPPVSIHETGENKTANRRPVRRYRRLII